MTRLIQKSLLIVCIAFVGLSGALMSQKPKCASKPECIYSYFPAGFSKKTTIIALELTRNPEDWRQFIVAPCPVHQQQTLQQHSDCRVSYLRTHTLLDFLFIVAYSGVFWTMLLLISRISYVRTLGLAAIIGIALLDVGENLFILEIIRNSNGIQQSDVEWTSKFAFAKWTLVFLLVTFLATLSMNYFKAGRVPLALISVVLILLFLVNPAMELLCSKNITDAIVIWHIALLVLLLINIWWLQKQASGE